MIVHKFGGTSVGDAGCFAQVAEIVQEQAAAGDTVVVLSAMSGVTSALIAGARAAADGRDDAYRTVKAALLRRHLDVVEALLPNGPLRLEVGGLIEDRLHELERLYRSIAILGELTVRGSDAVAAFGEPLSVQILSAVLRQRGTRAQAISATELIVTDDHFGAATPLWEPTRALLQARLRPLVEQGLVPVVTGYIGATAAGVTTTLGRGGSDYSAALLGAGLDADEVWIWSDVDGILTADPHIVPQARTLVELSYAEAADLAYFGADVLHPKTIRPVVAHGIPLRIRNSFRPAHPGTRIVQTPCPERRPLPAIISSAGLSLVAVGSPDDSWSLPMATRVLQCLAAAGVDVPMFSRSFSEHSLNLVLREQDRAHGLRLLQQEFAAALADDTCTLEARERVATVSVVGMPGWNHAGIVAHAFAALGRLGTRVIAVAQAAAEHSVSFCIPEEQLVDTVRFLHRELGLEDGDG